MTLERALTDYLDYLSVERGASPNTVEAYGRDLARYLAWLADEGVTDPDDVTVAMAEAASNRLSITVSLHSCPAAAGSPLLPFR